MINFNGNLVSSLSKGDEAVINGLFNGFSIEEKLRSSKGNVLLWETHYFRIIAALRRHRFRIPMEFTMEYLKNEIQKTIEQNNSSFEEHLIHFKFIKSDKSVFFIIMVEEATSFFKNPETTFAIDLYKEEWIASGFFSNLSKTNESLRIIADAYAFENGLEDCIMLNDQKNLVEATSGTLYLIQGAEILTPNLDSGCQDFAIRTAFNQWVGKENNKFTLIEKAINPFELQKSDGLILLSIEKGAQNVTHYRKTAYTQENVSSVFKIFLEKLD